MKIVITDAGTVFDELVSFDVFKQFGEVTSHHLLSYDELGDNIKDADIVLCNKSLMDENTLKKIVLENTNAIQFSDLKESLEYRRRMSKNPTEETFGGYVFGDNVLMKKAKSGALVSSEYVCAKMLLLEDAFYIRSCSFSFIADEKRESEIEIPFSKIEKVEIERDTKTYQVGKKELVAKTCFFVITHEGVQTRLPRKDDIYADELIVTLNRLLKKA